jgi:hypothetical protein
MSVRELLRRRSRVSGMVHLLEKQASSSAGKGFLSSEAGKAFMWSLGGGVASAGVAYGIPAALEGTRNARVRASKDKYVARMRSAHPELKNFSKRDVDLVYNSLSLHAPKVLKDPLVGGQVMVEALRRGNHMDLGQLANVSKMTGGTGISEQERDAANMLARQIGSSSSDIGRIVSDTRQGDMIMAERLKGEEMRRTETYKAYINPRGDTNEPPSHYKRRYQAYKKAKST